MTVTPMSIRSPARRGSRTGAKTSSPRIRRTRATWEPTKPVAPEIQIRRWPGVDSARSGTAVVAASAGGVRRFAAARGFGAALPCAAALGVGGLGVADFAVAGFGVAELDVTGAGAGVFGVTGFGFTGFGFTAFAEAGFGFAGAGAGAFVRRARGGRGSVIPSTPAAPADQ